MTINDQEGERKGDKEDTLRKNCVTECEMNIFFVSIGQGDILWRDEHAPSVQ